MVERLKRSAAAKVEVQPSPVADQRSEMLLRRYDTDLDVVIDNEFGGVEGEHRQQIGDLRTQVAANWQAANRHFVQIGMLILDAEHALPKAVYERLLASDRVFPFGPSVTTMLVQIARAIRDRRLTEDSLPTTYTVAYQVAAMKPEVLALAKERGLVRPDATKAELIEFKRQLRMDLTRPEAPRLNPAKLTRDLAKIDRKLGVLRAEVASLEAEKAEKARLLSLVADLVNSPAPPED
jgi:hypothetical protein